MRALILFVIPLLACAGSQPHTTDTSDKLRSQPSGTAIATATASRLAFADVETPLSPWTRVEVSGTIVQLEWVKVTDESSRRHLVAVLTSNDQVHLVDGQTGEVTSFPAPPASTWDIPRPPPDRPGDHQEQGATPWEWTPGECERLDGPLTLDVQSGEVALTRCIWGADSKYFDCRGTVGEVRVVLHREPHGAQWGDVPDVPTYPEGAITYRTADNPLDDPDSPDCGRVECTVAGKTHVLVGDAPEPECTWGSPVVNAARISRDLDRFVFYLASMHDGDLYEGIIAGGCPAKLERSFDPRMVARGPGPYWAYPQGTFWNLEDGEGPPTPVSAEHLVFTGAHPDR
jgi:hypothetical protein